MEAGVDGVLRDQTRKPGKAPVAGPVVERLVERTLGPPPGETTQPGADPDAVVGALHAALVSTPCRPSGNRDRDTDRPLLAGLAEDGLIAPLMGSVVDVLDTATGARRQPLLFRSPPPLRPPLDLLRAPGLQHQGTGGDRS